MKNIIDNDLSFVKRIIEVFQEVDNFKLLIKRFDYLVANYFNSFSTQFYFDQRLEEYLGKSGYKSKIVVLSKRDLLIDAMKFFKDDFRSVTKFSNQEIVFLLKNNQDILGFVLLKKNAGEIGSEEKDKFEIVSTFIHCILQKMVLGDISEKEVNYELMVEKAADIIYSCDYAGRFTYINPIGLKLSGYKVNEVIGNYFFNFVHPDYSSRVQHFYLNQFLNMTTNTYYEYPILKKNGQVLWLGQNVQLIKKKDRILRFHAVARDITSSKKNELA